MYEVALVVEDSEGCFDSTMREITIKRTYTYYVPNAFTPDQDGVNDKFGPKGSAFKAARSYSFYIFNRWGELIFESESINDLWDGKYKGEYVQNGVYVWKLRFTDKQRTLIKKTGHVNVLR